MSAFTYIPERDLENFLLGVSSEYRCSLEKARELVGYEMSGLDTAKKLLIVSGGFGSGVRFARLNPQGFDFALAA